jgi:hypothetical protein
MYFGIAANVRAFCCADIPCYVSREQKPIEKLKLKLNSFVEICLFSPDCNR